MAGLKLNHLSDSGSRSITKPDKTFDLNVVPFLAQYVYRKVLLLMVKRFTICDGFLIDRKIVVLTSFYNDRNTKNNRVYGHLAKFCMGKQKSHFLRFLRNISHFWTPLVTWRFQRPP